MKIIRILAFVSLALCLWNGGMWLLGVLTDLPMWRWLSGICCLAFSLVCASNALAEKS
jgi:hypothetical protein